MVGSLGTLGLIAEVILRTNPVPVTGGWLISTDADPFSVRDALHHPSAILWNGAITWLELEGHPADVEAEKAVLHSLGKWHPTEGPPALPPHRWSLRPSDLRDLDPAVTGEFVASIGVGVVFATNPQQRPPLPTGVRMVSDRVKAEFDPICRLSPGRDPMKVD
jgi:glycolate oxidase FAD binding subunit